MMVDANTIDCEDVRIGNWNSRLPSDICSNRKIFEEIFSLDTWNKILQPDQRDRILKLLPPEVSLNPEIAKQTIEDLLNGTLTTFSQNPVKGFFDKLNKGQYDPEVMEMKSCIMTEWRKESLRQLKSYHAKLLEDIVVSRQKHLSRIKGRPGGTSNNASSAFKHRSSDRFVSSAQVIDSSLQKPAYKRSSNTECAGAPRLDPVKITSRKRPLNNHSSETAECPQPSAKVSKPIDTPATFNPSSQQGLPVETSQSTISFSSKDLKTPGPSCVYLLKNADSNKDMTQRVGELPKTQLTQSKIPDDASSSGTSESISYNLCSPTKSSPILASQLQGLSEVNIFQNKSEDFEEINSSSITLNYYNKMEDNSSENDLETSSDEFETIEPTIGFGVTIPTPETSNLKEPSNSKKAEILKKPLVQSPQTLLVNNPSIVSLGPDFYNTKTTYGSSILIVNTTGTQLHPQTTTVPLTNSNSNIFGAKLLKLPIPKINTCHTNQPEIKDKDAKASDYFSKEQTTLSLQAELNSTTSQKATFLDDTAAVIGTEISTPQLATYNTSNENMELTNSSLSTANSTYRLGVVSSSASGPVNIISGLEDTTTEECETTNVLNFGHGDLNLDLSALSSTESGMNLNLSGLGTSDHVDDSQSGISMKMEIDISEKIDDLSVLDGNPFDSIPNLSDELDGLDLDLVDGLCDFEVLLSEEKKYPSFFCLIRDVLCSTKDHRMNLVCMEKTISKWCGSTGAALNSWFLRVNDWNVALVTALNFLAGSYQDVHPEDFVPYIEYKYKTKYYQWIGAGRDSDNNLSSLCSLWLDNLERLPSIKKVEGETEDQEDDDEENDDSELTGEDSKKKNKRPQTPPPPRFVTDWSVRQSTEEEKTTFRRQERSRFDNPHKAFTYKMHGYESVVGPVKGVYSSQVGMTNKARGHSLLVDDRPPYVTILALVRDAVARLPNGEGTRSDICEMLRDSAFLAPDASNVTLNSVVSGALDRLHYERDPCVRYDSHKKSWIYLHRDRTQDQFERLHHNRSYTKSTKCRNTGSRKPRKGISKLPPSSTSPTGTSTSASISSLLNSSVVSVSPSPKGEMPLKSANSDGLQVISKTTNNPEDTLKSSATVESLKCINGSYSAEVSSLSTAVKGLITQGTTFSTEALTPANVSKPFVKGQPQQIIIQTGDLPLNAIQAPNSVQIRTIRPISVNSIPTSTPIYCSQLTNQSLSTSSPTTTLTQGQFLLGPSTMLRLANTLRMSPFRLQGSAVGNPATSVRLPQHRILLTRGTVPVASQTQGVLLGQTSCGQTVILSTASGAISGLQTIGSLSARQFNDVSQRAVYTSNATPITISSTTPSISISSAQNIQFACNNSATQPRSTELSPPPKPVTVVQTKLLGNVGMGSSTPLLTSVNSSNPVEGCKLNVTNSMTVMDTQNTNSAFPSGVSESISYPIIKSSLATANPIPCSIVKNSQNQNNLPQQFDRRSENTTGNNQLSQTPMTSPIIIRSTQGEFVIPGHISLSRGVQGIKLFPLPMGNKTVLAKIIPNNPAPRLNLSSSSDCEPVETTSDQKGAR